MPTQAATTPSRMEASPSRQSSVFGMSLVGAGDSGQSLAASTATTERATANTVVLAAVDAAGGAAYTAPGSASLATASGVSPGRHTSGLAPVHESRTMDAVNPLDGPGDYEMYASIINEALRDLPSKPPEAHSTAVFTEYLERFRSVALQLRLTEDEAGGACESIRGQYARSSSQRAKFIGDMHIGKVCTR